MMEPEHDPDRNRRVSAMQLPIFLKDHTNQADEGRISAAGRDLGLSAEMLGWRA